MSRDGIKQLSRHERSEALDGPAIHPNPLRMRAGHADDRFARGVHADRAEQLGFLASHDVWRFCVALRNPWQDADVAILPRHRNGMLQDGCERRRRLDISGFHPALTGAGHAADDNWQSGCSADRFQMRLQHGRKAGLARCHHAFVAASFPEYFAGPVHQPKPKAAGAPIDRDVGRLFHFNPSECHLRFCDTVSRRPRGRVASRSVRLSLCS